MMGGDDEEEDYGALIYRESQPRKKEAATAAAAAGKKVVAKKKKVSSADASSTRRRRTTSTRTRSAAARNKSAVNAVQKKDASKRKRESSTKDKEQTRRRVRKRHRYECSADGCTKYAQRGGVCKKHGANVEHKRCCSKGCTNQAVIGGVCVKHGAKLKQCSSEGCTNHSLKRSVCWRHGAYRNQTMKKQKRLRLEMHLFNITIVLLALAALPCKCFVTKTLYVRTTQQPHQPSNMMLQNFDNFRKSQSKLDHQIFSFSSVTRASNFGYHDGDKMGQRIHSFSNRYCKLAPIWTLLAALVGVQKSSFIAPTLGSLGTMQYALSILMLAMGLTITPKEFGDAAKKPSIILLNATLCFAMMPFLAMGIASSLDYDAAHTAGIVLLGSVSGGQASNLFTLLAGGDVALSVVCTISTTFIGVLATPLLIKHLLQTVVEVNFISVFQSVASLVLLPLLTGLITRKFVPRFVKRIGPFCPLVGVLSTMVLVAGSAANSAFSLGMDKVSIVGSCLLPVLGCFIALLVSHLHKDFMDERSRRALVIETLSKSPTLAYVLARKHFDLSAATIPSAGMISLAVVGAVVACVWSAVDPIEA